ncbi:MAG: BACON domain-containing protein [Bryobacterales bacterium]|nr:BACON domain-containing protein [Bryobacterales bacterium]
MRTRIGIGVLGLLGAMPGFGQYVFRPVADDRPSSAFYSFYNWTINNNGAVAYTALLPNGQRTIRYFLNGTTTTVTSQYDSSLEAHALNDHGLIAFLSGVNGSLQIFTSQAGGSPTLVVGQPNISFYSRGIYLNNNGALTYVRAESGGNAIVQVSNGQTTTILPSSAFPNQSIYGASMNDSGVVAFGTANGSLYRRSGTTNTLLATNNYFDAPVINNSGTVAYATASGVYTTSGGSPTQATSTFPNGFSINNSGQVANIRLNSGVYVGNTKVIQIGDVLFDSVVTSLDYYYTSDKSPKIINDSGTVVFGYELANGYTGIATASTTGGGSNCTYSVSPTSFNVGSAGGSTTFTLTTQNGCPWTPTGMPSWISLSAGAQGGTADGSVTIQVAAHSGTLPRQGTLKLGGQTITVNQEAVSPCGFTVNPTQFNIPGVGGTGTVTITQNTSGTCQWQAQNLPSWISLTSAGSGTGNGSVSFSATANPNDFSRFGSFTVAGATVSITQAAQTCTYSLSPSSLTLPATAGPGTINLTQTAGGNCPWTRSGAASWISFTSPSSGSGSSTITFNAEANPNTTPRSTTFSVAGLTYTINQNGSSPCNFSFSPTSILATAAGGGGYNVSLSTSSTSCAWTVTGMPSWVTLNTAASGTGATNIGFTLAANPGPQSREATLAVAGLSYTIFQAAPSSCTHSVVPQTSTITAAGGTLTVDIQPSTPSCPWTVGTLPSWITQVTPTTGTGAASLQVTVQPNPSVNARSASIAIGTASASIIQDGTGTCTFTVTPASNSVPSSGGTATFTIGASNGGCAWTTTGLPNWIAPATASSGIGSGSVVFTVQANTGGGDRTATLQIAGQTVTIVQGSSGTTVCTTVVTPDAPQVGAAGGPVTFNITVSPSTCNWQISNLPSWITVSGASSGTGPANVQLNVAATTLNTVRSATILVANRTVVVTQASLTNSCTFTYSPSVTTLPAGGGTIQWDITASRSDCAWSLTSPVSWITFVGSSSGVGNGTVSLLVQGNGTGVARTGVFVLGGVDVVFSQTFVASGCVYSYSLPSVQLDGNGGRVSFDLTTGPSCVWSISGLPSWISLGGRNFGIGSTTLIFDVAAYTLANTRSYTLVIGGQSIVFTQTSATACPALATLSSLSPAAGGGTLTLNITASSGCGWSITGLPSWITVVGGSVSGTGSRVLQLVVAANTTTIQRVVTIQLVGFSFTITQVAGGTAGPVVSGSQFIPITPCRVMDTRSGSGFTGVFGGPTLAKDTFRTIPIPQGRCNIPASATAYSVNATVVPPALLSFLTLFPAGDTLPLVSTLNAFDGSVVANAAIVPAGPGGAINVYASDVSDVILDINGYFGPPATTSDSLQFFPVSPCRVADTRNATGLLGGPSLTGGVTRNFPVTASPCNIPANAKSYSLNVTVVPPGPLSYITLWPTGSSQPLASTLNSFRGKVVANAAVVPAGTNGNISVYATNNTHLVLDINGYYAPPASNGLQFYAVKPCRIMDTRTNSTMFAGSETRQVDIAGSPCGLPPDAKAYSLNYTVVPNGPLSYLSTWPTGVTQPLVSTLNSFDGSILANAALVPAGTQGRVNIFTTNQSHVIVDVNGYFAP